MMRKHTYKRGQVGQNLALVWERLVIDDMPVKHVELVLRHGFLQKAREGKHNSRAVKMRRRLNPCNDMIDLDVMILIGKLFKL